MNAISPKRILASGAGGGSGKQQQTPYEAPNSLRAKQTLRIMHLLGEGRIKGLVDGGKSIFLNDTPLIAADGTANFQGVTWDFRDGSPGQTAIPGYPAVENQVEGPGLIVQNGTPPIRTIDLTARDRIRFTIGVPALYVTDTSTGDIRETSVSYRVEWRPTGGSVWTTLYSDTISGKCVSYFPKARTGPSPIRASCDFRVVRETPDSNTGTLQNGITWASYTTILDRSMEYPGSAHLGMTIDAEQFNGSLPDATFELDGLICEVPSNYDPVARTYSGVWNGTFVRAWTSNPAWIFWTLCTDPDFGAGSALSAGLSSPTSAYAAAAALVDKWSLYSIAQYCDEPVDNGFGGTEPRYSCHAWINRQDEAYRVLQSIATGFRGMMYWAGGQIAAKADMPGDPVKLVTKANVIDGLFTYEGSAARARHSVVKVRWRDPQLNYAETIEVVDDPELIAQVGIREIEYEAIGCTSRGLAKRLGRWLLYTEKFETGLIRYQAYLDHAGVMPGQIIAVADADLAGVEYGGRLASKPTTLTSVQLDRPVTFRAGKTYGLRLTMGDGTVTAPLAITATAGVTTETIAIPGGYPSNIAPPEGGSVWILVASDVAPVTYRVLSISESREGTYGITALRHHAGKFGLIEQGLALNDAPFSVYGTKNPAALTPPSAITVTEHLGGVGATTLVRVIVSWTPTNDRRVGDYEAQCVRGGVLIGADTTRDTSITFNDLSPGTYEFLVRSRGADGQVSAFASSGPVEVDGRADPPTVPLTFTVTAGVRSNVLKWANPGVRTLRAVEVWASASSTFSAGGKVGESTGGQFVHEGLLPSATWYYWIRSADSFGQYSAWVGPLSATTSLLVAADIADGILNTSKFADGLTMVELFDAPPTTGNFEGRLVYDKTTGRLVQFTGGQFVNLVSDVQFEGQVGSGQIADASILRSKLGVGLGANLITNTCFPNSTSDWVLSGATATVAPAVDPWVLDGYGSGRIAATTFAAGATAQIAWTPRGDRVPVIPGDPYEFQARLLPKLFRARLLASFYDAAGALLGTFASAYVAPSAATAGSSLASYTLSALFATAPKAGVARPASIGTGNWPADAASVSFAIEASNPGGGSLGNPALYITQTLLSVGVPGQTEPSPWSPGGIADLDGAMLRPASLTSTQISELNATKLTGELAAAIFPQTLRPVEVLAALPTLGNFPGRQVYLTTDGKTYRYSGSAFTAAVPAGDISGTIVGTQISDGAISTEKLAANAVTAAKIEAGSITGDRLTAGTIQAGQIAASAIVASKLAVADTSNIIGNAEFSYDGSTGTIDDYTGAQLTAVARATTGVPSGAPTPFVGRLASATTNQTTFLLNGGYIPVSPGETYSFELWWASETSTASQMVCTLYYYDGNKANQLTTNVLTRPGGTNAWGRSQANFTVPATVTGGGATCYLRIQLNVINQASPLGAWYFTSLKLRRSANAELIVDGAITTIKLAAGSVTTAKLTVGATSNICWNSRFEAGLAGWQTFSSTGTPPTLIVDTVNGIPYGGKSAFLQLVGTIPTSGTTFAAIWAPDSSSTLVMGCKAGDRVQASAYLLTSNCTARLIIEFYDGAGAFISEGTVITAGGAGNNGTVVGNAAVGRNALGNYSRVGRIATAPANAYYCRAFVQGFTVAANASNPAVAITHFMFGTALPAQTELDAFVLGGVASIAGGVIQANTVSADRLLADTITSRELKTDSVTASKILAGSVSAEKLSVGSGANFVWNSCLFAASDGWSGVAYGTVSQANLLLRAAAVAFPTFSLTGFGSGFLNVTGGPNVANSASGFHADWRPLPTVPGIAVTPGTRYGAQALVQAHRCVGFVQILWHDGQGAFISTITSPSTTLASAGGLVDGQYSRLVVTGVAPPNAAYALLRILMQGNGGTDPYVFFSKVGLGEIPINATDPGPWVAGGQIEMRGGMITARTIQTDRLQANAITANELAANAVIAGKIQAGAVKAAEISAGEIKGVHIAAETIISQSVQIGTGVINDAHIINAAITSAKIGDAQITNAKIGNLEVTTLKIAGQNISASAAGHNNFAGVWTSQNPYFAVQLAAAGLTVEGDARLLIYCRTPGFTISGGQAYPNDGGGQGGDSGSGE